MGTGKGNAGIRRGRREMLECGVGGDDDKKLSPCHSLDMSAIISITDESA